METHDVSEFNQPNQAATCPSQDTAANGTCAASASIGYFLVSSGNLRFNKWGKVPRNSKTCCRQCQFLEFPGKPRETTPVMKTPQLRFARSEPNLHAKLRRLPLFLGQQMRVQQSKARCFPALHVGLKMTGRGFRRVRVWLKNHSWKWTSFCEQHLRICHQAHHSGWRMIFVPLEMFIKGYFTPNNHYFSGSWSLAMLLL